MATQFTNEKPNDDDIVKDTEWWSCDQHNSSGNVEGGCANCEYNKK